MAVFDQGDPLLRLLHDYEEVSHALSHATGTVDEKLLDRCQISAINST